jgi:hypothetical protein
MQMVVVNGGKDGHKNVDKKLGHNKKNSVFNTWRIKNQYKRTFT